MSSTFPKPQTRGRPRKSPSQKLPSISRKLFSQHYAVFYACCMVYVLQTFYETKNEKRIGHSEGGFTLYEKISDDYCFQKVLEDCQLWGMKKVLEKRELRQFVNVVNGCAPKFIFRQILSLVEDILEFIEDENILTLQMLNQRQHKLWTMTSEQQINEKFKYIRFSLPALSQLKLQKWHCQISQKTAKLWIPFVKIISYSIYCLVNNIEESKYFRPFFSDAENPQKTIIGQLDLVQIVQFVEKAKGVEGNQMRMGEGQKKQQSNQKCKVKQKQKFNQQKQEAEEPDCPQKMQLNRGRFQPILLSGEKDIDNKRRKKAKLQ